MAKVDELKHFIRSMSYRLVKERRLLGELQLKTSMIQADFKKKIDSKQYTKYAYLESKLKSLNERTKSIKSRIMMLENFKRNAKLELKRIKLKGWR